MVDFKTKVYEVLVKEHDSYVYEDYEVVPEILSFDELRASSTKDFYSNDGYNVCMPSHPYEDLNAIVVDGRTFRGVAARNVLKKIVKGVLREEYGFDF